MAGHAAEEIERLVTLPLELELNGVPHLEAMRSVLALWLVGRHPHLREGTDDYFARQVSSSACHKPRYRPG